MEAAIKQHILPHISFLIIDTENKTNKELKEEVYTRVDTLINKSKQSVVKELISEDSIENRVAYAMVSKTCKKEFIKIIRQFNFQIDQLVPAT